MSELTDLEICKRIAEIEGHETLPWDEYQEDDFYIVIDDHGEGYNPLTDDGLLWQLSKKYRVSIMHWEQWQREQCKADCDVIAHIEMGNGIWCASSIYFRKGDSSLNKSICLAIIEAHKGQL
jgi:hypothetical protein